MDKSNPATYYEAYDDRDLIMFSMDWVSKIIDRTKGISLMGEKSATRLRKDLAREMANDLAGMCVPTDDDGNPPEGYVIYVDCETPKTYD